VSQVTDTGEFSVRGDILDVFPANTETAIRIEFFGDEIEKIRVFDIDTQVSGEEIDSVGIAPFAEIFSFPNDIQSKVKNAFSKKLDTDAKNRADDIVSEILSSVEGGEVAYYQNWLLPFCKHTDICSFLGLDRIVIDDSKACYEKLETLYKEHLTRYESMLTRGETSTVHDRAFYAVDKCIDKKNVSFMSFASILSANRFFMPEAVYKIDCKPLPAYYHDFRMLSNDLEAWIKKDYTIRFCVSGNVRTITQDFLRDRYIPTGKNVHVLDLPYEHGCVIDSEKLVYICNFDLSARAKRKKLSGKKKDVFTAPEVGEYVVHETHGIGKCEGITKMNVMGANRDYLVISYADDAKLYVPMENMDSLSRYIASGASPKLSKIGGADFKKLKERVKQSVKKLAVDLMDLYSERLNAKGYAYNDDDSLLHDFEDRFPFDETEDQLFAVEECMKDLKSGKIMDRLLCGDVGYGKTEVALRVAFKVICEGKQVAILAPTTILAKQHFETVKRRMEEFGVNAVRVTRFDSNKDVALSISKLEKGEADIAVGTHKMLSKNVKFKDLGLLILDEEQRFGVSDKEKLKDVKRNVNVLTLSATPIPRTLHMSMVGIRDISILDTPPSIRIPVQTFVTSYNDTLLSDAVMREVGRGGQVFVVYNKVASIDTFTAHLMEMMPTVRFCVAHGQMPEKTLEDRIDAFVEGKYDVLVSSTIIENGIDMPKANTLFVVDADKMGLSQLYQLKGRVGRSDRMAYAYFTYDERKQMGESAYKRLEALASYTDFGSGFKIAMKDMEIRGAGNIMGAEQHGHMEKVGYDTYCTLLKEAIAEIEGVQINKKREVRMNVDYDTYVPESLVSEGDWRLRLYSKIAQVDDVKSREKLLAEIKDVYGDVPDPVKNLIDVAFVKNLASMIRASSVTLKKSERKIYFDRISDLTNAVNEEATAFEGTLVLAEKPYLKFRTNKSMVRFLLSCRKFYAN
jgi:transcription-repair coupling factor (superfamily II helicase)